jgi:hypothetical protein
MIASTQSPTQSSSVWAHAWRFLHAFDEALPTTEAGPLAPRVVRLERQVRPLDAENANSLGQSEPRHD